MCGIVGYIGDREAQDILLKALKRLEYRGYDSAGIAVAGSDLQLFKTKGHIASLEKILPDIRGTYGIAHTRWATHGPPSEANAHPFLDCKGQIALVHNGIIENFGELKARLQEQGHKFTSETDTEVLVHLIESYYNGDLVKAVIAALKEINGSFAIGIIHKDEDLLIGARKESPLVVGIGRNSNYLASDVPALLEDTNRVVYLNDGEIAVLTRDNVRILDLEGKEMPRKEETITWTLEDAEKGGYEHFMLKEIFEQPKAIRETLLGRIPDLDLGLSGLHHGIRKIMLVACGTAFHAAMVGKYILERLTKIPCTTEVASEFRFSPTVDPSTLVILVTQSGETADTLAALREARRRGCRTITITNVVGSTATREADRAFMTRAGPEIGVAATKTYTTQLTALFLYGIYLGRELGTLKPEEIRHLIRGLRELPRAVEQVLQRSGAVKLTAEWISKAKDIFFVGRGINYPTAMEGALKLKEISYIHAEGYAAGELKHGPIALFSPETPVVALAPQDHTYEKLIGNIRESSARGTPVIAVGFEGDKELQKYADIVLQVPSIPDLFAPVVNAVVLQLLAYYVALNRGCEIDKPRNLAKSVTVE
jgi:glucosamine--fructose-6-phosphate aminotransferase (isomerizing)